MPTPPKNRVRATAQNPTRNRAQDVTPLHARRAPRPAALTQRARRRVDGGGLSLTTTSVRHIPIQAHSSPSLDLLYRVPDQPALDGNTVDMDRERAQFSDNTLGYQTNLRVLDGQIKSMMSVLQQG